GRVAYAAADVLVGQPAWHAAGDVHLRQRGQATGRHRIATGHCFAAAAAFFSAPWLGAAGISLDGELVAATQGTLVVFAGGKCSKRCQSAARHEARLLVADDWPFGYPAVDARPRGLQ